MRTCHPTAVPNLLSFWDFQEDAGEARVARGAYPYRLEEREGTIRRVAGGVFGSYAALFPGTAYLAISRPECPALNIHGSRAQVTVVAWLQRRAAPRHGCEAVAGIWNEYDRRQYCLFLNIGFDGHADQVAGHVSSIGGPTPGCLYCEDVAIGESTVPLNEWQCCAFTYDGQAIRSYLNGKLDDGGNRNPYPYPGGIFDAGESGGDFTVGAVLRPNKLEGATLERPDSGNWFYGLLGGLAIYDRALTPEELSALAKV
jgi:hypothetical protein